LLFSQDQCPEERRVGCVLRITAVDCELNGSAHIEKMNLSDRVVVKMETTLVFEESEQVLTASAALNVFTEVPSYLSFSICCWSP
jgi:hypothetical protein